MEVRSGRTRHLDIWRQGVAKQVDQVRVHELEFIGDAGDPALRFTVRRNGVNDAVDYVVEVSEDLVGWRFDPALLTTVRDDGDALVVDVAMGPDSPVGRFARLRVVRR